MRRARALSIIALFLLSIALSFFMSINQTSAARGDGLLIYGEGTQTAPRYRTWTNSTDTLGSEQNGATAASRVRHTIMEAAPSRDEVLLGVQADGGSGVLYMQRWNGSTWSNEWNVTVGDGNLPKFDIAYERASGNAIVIYTGNVATTNELRYRTWDGTNWSGEQNYNPIRTSGIVDSVKLVSQKASNYVAFAWGDRNSDLSADFWDGDTDSFTGEPAAALSTNLSRISGTALTNQSFDLAFENVSNELLVAWGNDTVLDLNYVTRGAGTGGGWNTVTTDTAFFEEPTDIELKSEPWTDYIGYVNATDNGDDGDAAIWDGSAWGNISNYDTSVEPLVAGHKDVSGAWLQNGNQSRFVIIYDDNSAIGYDWAVFNKNTTTWAVQTDYTGAPAPDDRGNSVARFVSSPFNYSEAMAVAVDNTNPVGDLFLKKLVFDGTNLTWSSVEGGTTPEGSISSETGLSADFVYFRYTSPTTLGVDMVDSTGTPVASPSISFNALTTSFSCQTTNTATLGTSSEKIRISNGSGNQLWTLSIAATGGVTSNWTNGSTGQYDFNDGAGAPAGCSDGGDADNLPGRLTFDASGSTIVELLSDCGIGGITKGSSASFEQGSTDAVTLLNTSSSAVKNCDFDLTGVSTSQQVPQERPIGTYTLNMTLTTTAN